MVALANVRRKAGELSGRDQMQHAKRREEWLLRPEWQENHADFGLNRRVEFDDTAMIISRRPVWSTEDAAASEINASTPSRARWNFGSTCI